MSIRRNSIYNIAGAVIPLVLALVTVPLYLKAVGTERYGALAIAWLILGYFGLFDLGLGRATAQRIAALHDSTPDHRASVFWTAVAVNIAIGAVGAVLLFFGARYFFLNHFKAEPALVAEMLDAVWLLAAAVPVATLTGVLSGALQGREKFLDVNMATVAGTSLFTLLPLIVAYVSGPQLSGLIIAAVIARVLGLTIIALRVHKHLLAGAHGAFDRSEWLNLLKFGGWVSLTALVGPFILIADRLLIGAVLGSASVAVYAVAFDIARRISLIPNAVGQAIFPRIAQSNGDERRKLMLQSLGALDLLMTLPVMAAVFLAGPFLELWVGKEIGSQATMICQILLIAYWANAFAVIPYATLQAQGRPDIVAFIILAQLPIYLAALWALTQAYGLAGAAAVVFLRSYLEVFVMLYFANRRLAIPANFLINSLWLAAAFALLLNIEVISPEGVGVGIVALVGCMVTSWLFMPHTSKNDIRIMLARFGVGARKQRGEAGE